MSRHRAGVTESKIHELVTVERGDVGAPSRREREGESPGPLIHPGHGHTAKEVIGTGILRLRTGISGLVTRHFSRMKRCEPVAVNRSHGSQRTQ